MIFLKIRSLMKYFFLCVFSSQFRIFLDLQYQGGAKFTVFGVFEDLKFKISEGYKKNWDSQQGSDMKTSILIQAFWNLKPKVLKYQWNCRPHATVISILVKPLIVFTSTLNFLTILILYFCDFVDLCDVNKTW